MWAVATAVAVAGAGMFVFLFFATVVDVWRRGRADAERAREAATDRAEVLAEEAARR